MPGLVVSAADVHPFRIVFYVRDLIATVRALEASGFSPWGGPVTFLHAVRTAVFIDPVGVRVHLVEHQIPADTTSGSARLGYIVVPTLSVEVAEVFYSQIPAFGKVEAPHYLLLFFFILFFATWAQDTIEK